jgi:hypothetical protein
MKIKRKFKLGPRFICSTFILMCFWMMVNVNSAYAEWHHGIGTGIARLNVEGDMGFDTVRAGPVTFDVDLDPDDIDDLMETAFGFGGYSTDGTWTIQYALSKLVLEGDDTIVTPGGDTVTADVEFDMAGVEITAGRTVIKREHLILGLYGGVRYTAHDFSSDLTINGILREKDIDEDWIDALIGGSIGVPFAEKWLWNNRIDVGFGGSEGTTQAYSGLTWKFLKKWSGTLYAKVTAVEYENDDEGDADWYLYDVDESTAGLTILFNW